MPRYDVILVGGGLSNSLIAYRLSELQPRLNLLIIEASDRLGGNHTWSYHSGDLTSDQHAWIAPLVSFRWPGYEVLFHGRRRQISSPYLSIASADFGDRVADKLDGAVLADAPVESLTPTSVTLSDGRLLEAGAVIDGRGGGVGPHLHVAYQKFLGREVQLTEPHNLEMPVLMDSTVDQRDGYRFVYLLPLEPNRILVEDTYYSDTPSLDKEALRVRIESYMSARGWSATSVLREESGILPIVLGGNVDAHIDSLEAGVPTVGLRGGFFHATTGYSLPYAVRIADLIAAQADLGASALHRLLQHQARAHWRRQRFYQLLNRMLFLAAAPDKRHLVMRRFYGLPAPLISRFYAGHTTLADKARILTGRPPVPIRAALRALAPRRLQTYSRNVQA